MGYKKLAIAATSAFLATFAFAHPSSAASPEWDRTVSKPAGPPPAPQSECKTTPKIKLCFTADGDDIWLKDRIAGDGFPAQVDWSIRGGRYGQCYGGDAGGAWGMCNKDFPERKLIDFIMRHVNDSYTLLATT